MADLIREKIKKGDAKVVRKADQKSKVDKSCCPMTPLQNTSCVFNVRCCTNMMAIKQVHRICYDIHAVGLLRRQTSLPHPPLRGSP